MSLIKKKGELEFNKNLFLLIYSQPSAWKTSTALSASKPLLFDIEKGCQRVNVEWQSDTVQPTTYSEILEVLEKEDLSNYETLIFDTLLALNDLCMEEVLRENPTFTQKDGTPSLKAYGVAKNKFKTFVSLLEKQQKTIIFLAHSTEQKNQENIEIRIDGSSSAIKEITKKLDAMCYISVLGRKRYLNFEPNGVYYAKPIQNVETQIEIPYLEHGQKNTFLQDKVITPALEYRKGGSNRQSEYENVLKQAKEIIAKGVNDESLAKLRQLKKIGDSQERIKEMLDNAKATK